jgi:hypothetical protein
VFGRLGGGITTELKLDDVSARVLITDCRTVVVCRRFLAKDGRWIGFGWGAAFALVANLVHKARAAAEGSGKAAVGHVRHEWVRFVGWREKAAGGSADEVRIGFRLPGEETTLVVDLRVPADLNPGLVATEVLRRVARHRLASGAVHDPAARQRYAELANGRAPTPVATGFAVVELPGVGVASPVNPIPAVTNGSGHEASQ